MPGRLVQHADGVVVVIGRPFYCDARTDAGGFLAVSKLCLMSELCRWLVLSFEFFEFLIPNHASRPVDKLSMILWRRRWQAVI